MTPVHTSAPLDGLRRRRETLECILTQPCLATATLAGVRLASRANLSAGHSRVAQLLKAKTNATQRGLGALAVAQLGGRAKVLALVAERGWVALRLVRGGPRRLDDDNLASAFKSLRDGIARTLGVDDRHPSVRYEPDECVGRDCVVVELYAPGGAP